MKKFLSFLLILAVLFPTTALADDASLGGTGETVYPVKNTDVVMQKEVIDIRVKDGKSYVTCRFYFKNSGKTAQLLMGFPSFQESRKGPYGDKYTKEDMKYIGDLRLYRFRTYIDGRRIPVQTKKGMKKTAYNKGEGYYPVWYAWNLRFKKGQTRKVTNTYWCYNTYAAENNSEEADYILKTGAYWKGNIGSVLVRMHLPEINPLLLYSVDGLMPDYYTADGTLVWNKKDLEPDRDIAMSFGQVSLYNWINLDKAGNLDEDYLENLKSYDSLVRLENHFSQKHYRSTIWWGERIRRIFKKEKQPGILNYYMGVAYYNRHLYAKALKELGKCGAAGLYHKALCLQKLRKTKDYKACLKEIIGLEKDYPGLALWGRSRLEDMKA